MFIAGTNVCDPGDAIAAAAYIVELAEDPVAPSCGLLPGFTESSGEERLRFLFLPLFFIRVKMCDTEERL